MFRRRPSLSQPRGDSFCSLEGRRPGDGPSAAPADPTIAVVGLLDAADAVVALQLQTLEAKTHDGLALSGGSELNVESVVYPAWGRREQEGERERARERGSFLSADVYRARLKILS